MAPTDHQLVDALLAAIKSTSCFIELIMEEEIEAMSRGQAVNIARLKALDTFRRDFHLRALIMEYLLHVPSKG